MQRVTQGRAPSGFAPGWSHERVETLKTRWADGVSASVIADELGHVTRNAVIGKIHRLNLPGRVVLNHKPRSARVRRYVSRKTVAAAARHAPVVEAYVEPEPIDDLAIPAEQRRTLTQLTETTCKWPVGHPGAAEFFFCGAAHSADDPLPYCPAHSIRAVNGIPPRKPRPIAAWR